MSIEHCDVCRFVNHEELIEAYKRGVPDKEIRSRFQITRPRLHELLVHLNVSKRDPKIVRDHLRHCIRAERYVELVECRICGVKFRTLGEHLRVIHEMTIETYQVMYGFDVAVEVADVHTQRSEAAKRKYILHPELKETLREVGRQNMTSMNERGLGWKMPVGYHTEEHKRHMSELLTGRNVTWVDKIRDSHWTKRADAHEIVDRIVAGNKRYKRGWYQSSKTGQREFFHSSFEERRMHELDADPSVVTWTKRHGIRLTYTCRGKVKVYVPDFLIRGVDSSFLEEVKGYIHDLEAFTAKCEVATQYCEMHDMKFVVNRCER